MVTSTIIISDKEKESLDITGRVIIARSSRYKDHLGYNQDMFGANVTYKKYSQHPSRVYLFGYCLVQLLDIERRQEENISLLNKETITLDQRRSINNKTLVNIFG